MKNAISVIMAFFLAVGSCLARDFEPTDTHAVLNVSYINDDDKPHAHKKLTFVGQNDPRKKVSVTTNAHGEASLMIPRDDTYAVICETVTGPFECGETPYVSMTASVGSLTVVFDDTRVELKGVTFKAGSAELEMGSLKTLDAAIEGLKKNPQARVEIEGHTSSEGDDDFNQTLSAERAYSVRVYMIENGIDENRVTATGYGSSQPKADNSTEYGRQKNRRIEIRVLNTDEVEVHEI